MLESSNKEFEVMTDEQMLNVDGGLITATAVAGAAGTALLVGQLAVAAASCIESIIKK